MLVPDNHDLWVCWGAGGVDQANVRETTGFGVWEVFLFVVNQKDLELGLEYSYCDIGLAADYD